MNHSFDAYVAAALFPNKGSGGDSEPVYALGDGAVQFGAAVRVQAHEGTVLCAGLHPSGEGVVTGGDDGRLVWSRASGAEELADLKGKWIDALDVSAESGLIAFAAGRDVHVRDVKDTAFARSFKHERSAAGVAFDPKGRRIAVATYGGVQLWYARIAEQQPQTLKWAGSHIGVAFSPDGRFLLSAMQENALHGWRLADGKDLKMGGYPAKPKSIAFLSKGALMATSGAGGAVIWPFAGANGPMGKEAVEIGAEESALVTQVAAHPAGARVCAGLDDGRVWTADLTGRGVRFLKAEKGGAITALAISPDGRTAAWGAEDGEAGSADLAALTSA
jgi:WD40 repeat protein